MNRSNLTRRQALRLTLSAGALAALVPQTAAFADAADDLAQTESELQDVQNQVDEVQKELDQIAADYEKLAEENSQTRNDIDATQKDIDAKEADLAEKRKSLSDRVSEAYKSGDDDMLAVLLSSTSLDELSSNIYYLSKISESDRKLIQDVKDAMDQLTQKKKDLDALNETQQQQMQEMESKQDEASDKLNSLTDQQKQLMEQRDEEMVAAAKEKAEQEAAAKAAAAAAAAANSSSNSSDGGGSSNGGGSNGRGGSNGGGNGGSASGGGNKKSGSQQRVVSACYATPSPGAGLCAMWVSQVFQNAGLGYPSGNACDMYNAWCTSASKSALKPGMIVAVSSHSSTPMGRIYGHVGIYVGGGMVMQNIGSVNTQSLDSWIAYYGDTVTPRWGWCMGIPLT
ncbi:peptidoglycan hydrolase CwlO-like protein [Olsenella profusa DSM 13989]|uniref:coiled-coil domain-containing protein n=1 Tax=Olsenella profusa TaxID=138595 RepID=UPI00277E0D0B|nr:hypothetical protein [Olsenella profusa]MDP9859866.1 peptidoglycan hydrolase CwlO-like protein [Olsenella profusa DSM 13989]